MTHWLAQITDKWLVWMVEMAWQSALLVAVLFLLDRILRRASARFLHAVWLLILLRLIVPPSTTFPTGIGWWIRESPAASVSLSDLPSESLRSSAIHETTEKVLWKRWCPKRLVE
jgi:beta-lactamase regulating signal transducer with metallopeptidase domain